MWTSYWGAVGLSALGTAAAPAVPVLQQVVVSDASPWVQAQAADALAVAGQVDAAVPFLGGLEVQFELPMAFRLQAAASIRYRTDPPMSHFRRRRRADTGVPTVSEPPEEP